MYSESIIPKLTGRCDNKLLRTMRLEDHFEKRQAELKNLYSQDDLTSRLFAMLLNAIYTEGKTTFLMSLDLMRQLVVEDHKNGNFDRKTLNDKEYKKFVMVLRKQEIIEVLSESQKMPRLAATWELVDRNALKIIDIELNDYDEEGYPWDYVEQMQATTDAYFESGLYDRQETSKETKIDSQPTDKKSNRSEKQEYNFD